MASSRVFLLLALVAVLLCGAFAASSSPKSYGNKAAKFAVKKCLKAAGAGCKTCTDDETEGEFVCTECKTGYAFDDNDRCVCDDEQDYGRVTKAQWKAWKSGGYKVNTYGKHAKFGNCVDCTLFGLEAEDNEDGVSICTESD